MMDRWKDIVEFTDQLWKYKDVILSIDKVNRIEYVQNYNVTFGLRKYNNINYIFVNNLEREKEIFKINLMEKYNIYKEFGLGKIKINGNEITFYLEPIDVKMIKYSKNSSSNFLLVAFIIIIIIIIIVMALIFIVKRYLNKKSITKTSMDSVSKLTGD